MVVTIEFTKPSESLTGMKAGQFEMIRVREQRGSDARYLREILEDIKAGRAPADAFIP